MKDGLVVGRLNSSDLAPNPIGLQVTGRTSAVYLWSGTERSLGHSFCFHRYLQQWVFISCGSPCTTLIWLKFASNTQTYVNTNILEEKYLSTMFPSCTSKCPAQISLFPSSLERWRVIVRYWIIWFIFLLLKIIKYRASQEGKWVQLWN